MKGHAIVPHPAGVGFTASGATFDEIVDEAISAIAEIGSGGATGGTARGGPCPGRPRKRP